jgi:hypothetical protein
MTYVSDPPSAPERAFFNKATGHYTNYPTAFQNQVFLESSKRVAQPIRTNGLGGWPR